MSGTNATTPPSINQTSPFIIPSTGVLSQYGENTLLEMEQQVTTLQSQGLVYLGSWSLGGSPTTGAVVSIPAGTIVPAGTTCGFIQMCGGGGAGGNGGGTVNNGQANGGGSGATGALGVYGWISALNVAGFAAGAILSGSIGNAGYVASNGTTYSANATEVSIAGTLVAQAPAGVSGGLGGSAYISPPAPSIAAFSAVPYLKAIIGGSGSNGTISSGINIGGAGGTSMFAAGGQAQFVPNSQNLNGNGGGGYGAGGGGGVGVGLGGSGGVGFASIDWFGYPP